MRGGAEADAAVLVCEFAVWLRCSARPLLWDVPGRGRRGESPYDVTPCPWHVQRGGGAQLKGGGGWRDAWAGEDCGGVVLLEARSLRQVVSQWVSTTHCQACDAGMRVTHPAKHGCT